MLSHRFQAKLFTQTAFSGTISIGDIMQVFKTKNYEETVSLAEKFGKQVKKGTVIAFYGGLGTGKTAFTTGVAKGMGIKCDVSSPTFAIVNVYGKNSELCHFDMYRVSSWMTSIRQAFLIIWIWEACFASSGVKISKTLCPITPLGLLSKRARATTTE